MTKRKPLYMSNVATDSTDAEGNRFTDREVSDKPFPGQGSEYFSSNASEAGAGRGRVNPARGTPKVEKKAKGGVTRADGCVTKGHTKGKMV